MLQQLKKTYKGKKVFITGHTGFKGSWLLKTLHMAGAEVCGYALSPQHKDDLFNLINGTSLCKSIIADLRDREKLSNSIVEFEPDFIFHLAAQPLVRLSYDIPAETFEVNAIGTANLLDSVRQMEKRCDIVLITTDKVYHNNEWLYPYRENDRLGGYDPYSASKACTELVIESYRQSFFNLKDYSRHKKSIAVGRAGNVIGGGDWSKDRLLPDIARALGAGQKVVIRNPYSVRPWQHVLEPLGGYLQLGAKQYEHPQQFAQAYNLGPQAMDALQVEDMVKIAIQYWGQGTYEVQNTATSPHEAGLLKLDISKALGELGWTPRYDAGTAVAMTMEWYKLFYSSPGDIVSLTESQILNFFND